jgi:hydroxyethylthiazole kinase-like uncharacterized protein yjeF
MDILNNNPILWQQSLPKLQENGHKFDRGFAIFWGAAPLSGAIRLAAASARRTGVGLAGVVSSRSTHTLYGEHPGVLTFIHLEDSLHHKMRLFLQKARDPRVTAISFGSGLSPSSFLNSFNKRILENLLDQNKPLIIDGGALHPLWFTLDRSLRNVIFTPHKGEATRLLSLRPNQKVSMEIVHDRFKESDATIVLKGAQTLIARAHRPWVIQESAPCHLATAGTGDVLTGIITSLVAQRMPIFDASTAGVWIHTQAAKNAGSFMIAEDLINHLQTVMQDVYENRPRKL